jgi:FAD/FMN-containing dehydrogenase
MRRQPTTSTFSRRSFLAWSAVGLGAAATGCSLNSREADAAEGADALSAADWQGLSSKMRGKLVLPGQADYAQAKLGFNPLYDSNSPGAVAQVTSADDVAACIEFAREKNLTIAARSGGHSYAGYSTPNNGLVVDLGNLTTINVNGDSTVDIGAGSRLGDIYTTLGGKGVCIPGGSCPSVGVGGLTLGGGIGVLARLHGLTCDNLLAANIVLPDGTQKTVSADVEPDLFWGLRGGGGGNFGIVTNFKFQSFAAPDIVVFSLKFPAGSVPHVLGAWQQFMQTAPNELWTTCVVSGGNPPTCRISGAFAGPESTLNGLLAQLKSAIGTAPISASQSAKGYLDAMRYFGGCSTKTSAQCHLARPGGPGQIERESFYASSRILEQACDPQKVSDLMRAYAGTDLLFDSLGGQVAELGNTDTAFAHRSAIASIQIYKSCTVANKPAAVKAVGDIGTALSTICGKGSYANYIDPNQGDWAAATYGENLGKLQSVLTQYDPDKVFGFKQSLHATMT